MEHFGHTSGVMVIRDTDAEAAFAVNGLDIYYRSICCCFVLGEWNDERVLLQSLTIDADDVVVDGRLAECVPAVIRVAPHCRKERKCPRRRIGEHLKV